MTTQSKLLKLAKNLNKFSFDELVIIGEESEEAVKSFITEAIENKNIIAVQWHPEYMNDIKFFEYFINKISNKDH